MTLHQLLFNDAASTTGLTRITYSKLQKMSWKWSRPMSSDHTDICLEAVKTPTDISVDVIAAPYLVTPRKQVRRLVI